MRVINAAVLFVVAGMVFVEGVKARGDGISLKKGARGYRPVEMGLKGMVDTASASRFWEGGEEDVSSFLEQRFNGYYSVRRGPLNNDANVRGMGGDALLVESSGVRLYNSCPNRMDSPFSKLFLLPGETGVLVKGPFDMTRYGGAAGSVVFGKVFVTKGLGAVSRIMVNTHTSFAPSAYLGWTDERKGVRGGYGFARGYPYRDGSGRRITEYAAYKSPIPAFNKSQYTLSVFLKLSKNHFVEAGYMGDQEKDVLYPALMMDARRTVSQGLYAAYRGTIGAFQLKVLYSYHDNLHEMDDRFRLSSEDAPLPYSMRVRAGTWTSRGVVDVAWKNDLQAGLEVLHRTWTAFRYTAMMNYRPAAMIPHAQHFVTGFYSTYASRLARDVAIQAGGRADYSVQESDASEARGRLLFSAMAALQWKPLRAAVFYLKVGRKAADADLSQRYISAATMKYTWKGNPELKPYSLNEVDVGAVVDRDKVSVMLSVFLDYADNLIIVRALPDSVFSYANQDALITGFELRVEGGLPSLRGGVSMGYARGRKVNFAEGEDPDLYLMPPFTYRTFLRFQQGGCSFMLEWEGALKQDLVDEGLGEEKTPAWNIVNLRGVYALGPFKIEAGLENVMDRFFVKHFSYIRNPFCTGVKVPEPGRTAYINLVFEM